jgi:hypothetical protein
MRKDRLRTPGLRIVHCADRLTDILCRSNGGDIVNQPQVVNPKRKHGQVSAPKRGHRHTTPIPIPTDAPNHQEIGKQQSLMQPSAWVDMHPFAATLKEWEQGVPVDCGEPWAPEAIRLAVERGPHRSALTPDAMALIEEEIQYQIAAGFSEIVMWDDIRLSNMPRHPPCPPNGVAGEPQLLLRGDGDWPRYPSSPSRL